MFDESSFWLLLWELLRPPALETPGGDPKKFFEFEDKQPSQLVRYDKDWYFVAN